MSTVPFLFSNQTGYFKADLLICFKKNIENQPTKLLKINSVHFLISNKKKHNILFYLF